jgi:DNA-binding NtrC family response regulator
MAMAKAPPAMRAVVFDETLAVALDVHAILVARGIEASLVGSAHELRQVIEGHARIDLLIAHLGPGLNGWQLAHLLGGLGERPRALVFLSDDTATGLDHLRHLPRVHCLATPADRAGAGAAVDEVLARVAAERAGARADPAPAAGLSSDIIGESAQARDVLARIAKVAPGEANVCVVGESGTGKELIARTIHFSSLRRDRPLVALDCTAVPEALMESHLFGRATASSPGATEGLDGVFSLAHTGTLFIDEINAMPLPLQARLLQVIQTREFQQVGDRRPIATDIRLITASSKDLRRAVAAGTFRGDLYYRIAVVVISTAPLRERPADIPLLVKHFLPQFARAHRKAIRGLTPAAMDLLVGYQWPGNVRQLEHCLEQAVVLCDGDRVDVDVLPLADPMPGDEPEESVHLKAGLTLRQVEQEYVLRTLRDTGGNRTRTARILGISLRCLQYKLKAYAEDGVRIPVQPHRASEPRHLLGV